MTKETLQSYQALKREVRQLDRLMRSPEAEATVRGKALGLLYKAKRDRLGVILQRIEDALDALEPTERIILRGRYVEGRSWTAICTDVHYSRTSAIRIHDRALRKLTRKA